MKHPHKVTYSPYKVTRTSLGFAIEFPDGVRVTLRSDPRITVDTTGDLFCTLPAGSFQPSGVALGGLNAQGGCTPSARVVLAQFRAARPRLAAYFDQLRVAA
jgi:hypothetical protein